MDYSLTPRVLLTHIRLYRKNGTSCGPYRSSKIIDQVFVLYGHDHDQCTVAHASKYGPVIEVSNYALAEEVLLKGLQGHRPVTLLGFSLGARVIFKCLQILSKFEKNAP